MVRLTFYCIYGSITQCATLRRAPRLFLVSSSLTKLRHEYYILHLLFTKTNTYLSHILRLAVNRFQDFLLIVSYESAI